MSAARKWVEIDVPRGAYLGWGNKPGQQVVGKVVRYDEVGGTDFAGDTCPSLELVLDEAADSFNKAGERTSFEAGDTVQLNCGQVSLKRAVRKAELSTGDLVKIALVNLVKTNDGRNTVKEFSIAVVRAEDSSGNDFGDEEPDF